MDRPVTQVFFAGLVTFISRLFCTLQRPCCFHYLSNICQRNPEMELRLEPKNSRAPNPYGSFPWMLGKNNLLQNLFYFLLFCIVGPGAVMCGRDPGDFIDITITSCPPEVRCCLIITINITLCYRCTPATLVPALPWPTSATPRSSAWTSRTRPTANILRCCR